MSPWRDFLSVLLFSASLLSFLVIPSVSYSWATTSQPASEWGFCFVHAKSVTDSSTCFLTSKILLVSFPVFFSVCLYLFIFLSCHSSTIQSTKFNLRSSFIFTSVNYKTIPYQNNHWCSSKATTWSDCS